MKVRPEGKESHVPKRYRIALVLYDEDDTQLREDSHEEMYDDDTEASEKFGEKQRAARKAGKKGERSQS